MVKATSKSVKSPKASKSSSKTLKGLSYGEYNGHKLVVVGDPEDQWGSFSFGKKKAKMLIEAIDENGADAVIDFIRGIVD